MVCLHFYEDKGNWVEVVQSRGGSLPRQSSSLASFFWGEGRESY